MRGRIAEYEPPLKRARLDEPQKDSKDTEQHAVREQQQFLVRLVEERRSQLRRIEEQSRDIQAQLCEAQKKLSEAEAQLACLRRHPLPNHSSGGSNADLKEDEFVKVKLEPDCYRSMENRNVDKVTFSRKPVLIIPGSGQDTDSGPNVRVASDSRSCTVTSTIRGDTDIPETFSRKPMISESANVKSETQSSAETKANKSPGLNKTTHADLVLCVRGSKAPSYVNVVHSIYFPSQHKRKLRSLAMNPASGQMCVTSALDGLINIWKIQGKGDDLSLVSSVDCLSPGQRRWPEDIAWHPSGESLFACYSADGNDNQVAIISSLSKGKVHFLEDKPHDKGIINSLGFIPWNQDTLFATGGCDHAVVLWRKEESCHWKPEVLHKSLHSSAVMGVAGIQHKQLMLSVGVDKRVIGFDTHYGRAEFCYLLDSKALGLLPNPVDLNLYMVQTGTPGQQLRLFDLRMQRSELHAFGWRQESSESQSALIHQSWSPDGVYIASGSTDPKVHIFDIRYNSKEPSQSIKAHRKRVFKAAWHHTLPLLISISSDLNIGLFRLSM